MKDFDLKIKKDVSLANHTSFGIGGPADYFIGVENNEQIVKAIQWAKEKKIACFILGGGSNLLVSDKGVKGLVIKIKTGKLKIKGSFVYAEAGVSAHRLALETAKRGLSGLHFFAGLPGTVGGAIFKNSHWRGHFFSDHLVEVEVLDEKLKKRTLKGKDLKFSYDWSSFQKEKLVILRAVFSLKKANPEDLKTEIKEVLNWRQNKQPKGKSAGSIFKNPKDKSAGFLIEAVGLKGKKNGGALISNTHANFFINQKEAKAKEIVELMKESQKKIKEKFNIKLEPEIFFWGFDG